MEQSEGKYHGCFRILADLLQSGLYWAERADWEGFAQAIQEFYNCYNSLAHMGTFDTIEKLHNSWRMRGMDTHVWDMLLRFRNILESIESCIQKEMGQGMEVFSLRWCKEETLCDCAELIQKNFPEFKTGSLNKSNEELMTELQDTVFEIENYPFSGDYAEEDDWFEKMERCQGKEDGRVDSVYLFQDEIIRLERLIFHRKQLAILLNMENPPPN